MIKLILNILIKGLKGANKLDPDVAGFINKLPKVFYVKINIQPKNINIAFKIENGKISNLKPSHTTPYDLVVEFKNEVSAKLVLLGRKSIAQSFSEHNIILFGNINDGVNLVHAIDIVEDYLFPKFMVKNSLKNLPKRKRWKIRLYFYLVFGI